MIIKKEVLQILSQATATGNCLYLPGNLERALYQQVDKVLKLAGGQWHRFKRTHVFTQDCADLIDHILQTGSITTPQDFGFFPTPLLVAQKAVQKLQLEDGMRVLEPSAGKADLVKPIIGKAIIDCIELQETNVNYLRMVEGLNNIDQNDFLTTIPNPIYDRVLMNPPFLRNTYVSHIRHAFNFLRPNGRLVAIGSAAVEWHGSATVSKFRDFIRAHKGEIQALPANSFRPSGVQVDTVLITIPNMQPESYQK